MTSPRFALILFIALAACGEPGTGGDESFGGDSVLDAGAADGLGVTAEEAAAILHLVNTATLVVLDDDVRLDARAAANIVSTRTEAPIATLDELDAVPWVGASAFRKLREYVHAHGLVGTSADCLIISEYIEGKADKNKAVEIMNCGTSAIDLDDIAICLIRNDDTDCSVSTSLAGHELASNQTLTMCRQRDGQWMNPQPWIAEACEVEIGSTAIFSGDDRLALVRDTNADGRFTVNGDEVLDVLGRITYRPRESPWNDVRLERCRLEPNYGKRFYTTSDWFHVSGWTVGAGGDLGVAPPSEAQCLTD